MVAMALLQHYMDYITSPGVLLAILTVVGPIYLEIFRKWRMLPKSSPDIPGCFRLGLSKKSNLDDQYQSSSNSKSDPDQSPRIEALFTYPVKSCRGVELAASQVGPTGLKYDRLFTFARRVSRSDLDDTAGDETCQWRFITQREFPRLALIQTELWVPKPAKTTERDSKSEAESQSRNKNGGCLILRFSFEPAYNFLGIRTEDVVIPLALAPTEQHVKNKGYEFDSLSIWKDITQAINITSEIPADDLIKLKSFLRTSNDIGLFRVDNQHLRAVTRSLPRNRPNEAYSVGFADAFPFHLLNLASVRAQDQELPIRGAMKGSLDARRFRANIYVSGPPAYDEDSWKRVTIGKCVKPRNSAHMNGTANGSRKAAQSGRDLVETDGEYHVACRTARCKLPNVDQDTGIKDANEPLTTLNRTRKVDKGAYPHPCLGMQMIPLFEQGILRVGDEINVLERGEHVYEKMFA